MRSSYGALHPTLTVARYLSSPSIWARRLRTQLRMGLFEHIGDFYKRSREHHLRVPCDVCGSDTVETVDHFLLHCVGFAAQRGAWDAAAAAVGNPVLSAALRASPAGTVPGDDLRRALLLGGVVEPLLAPHDPQAGRRMRPVLSRREMRAVDSASSVFIRDVCRLRRSVPRA